MTVLAGLVLRAVTGGTVAKVGGVALYGTMIYAVLVPLRPGRPPTGVAALAGAVCWAVEFAQLTPYPAAASSHSMLARLALGSTFHPPDLAAYPVGILLGVLVQLSLRRILSCRPGVAAPGGRTGPQPDRRAGGRGQDRPAGQDERLETESHRTETEG